MVLQIYKKEKSRKNRCRRKRKNQANKKVRIYKAYWTLTWKILSNASLYRTDRFSLLFGLLDLVSMFSSSFFQLETIRNLKDKALQPQPDSQAPSAPSLHHLSSPSSGPSVRCYRLTLFAETFPLRCSRCQGSYRVVLIRTICAAFSAVCDGLF